MIEANIREAAALAEKLYGDVCRDEDIYPPTQFCFEVNACARFLIERDEELDTTITTLLNCYLLDRDCPELSVELRFFIRERLLFAWMMFDAWNEPLLITDDVHITVEATTSEHLLLWMTTAFWQHHRDGQLYTSVHSLFDDETFPPNFSCRTWSVENRYISDLS